MSKLRTKDEEDKTVDRNAVHRSERNGRQAVPTVQEAHATHGEKVTYPIKILAALNTVMSKVGYVQKQGKNAFHNYKYAGEGHLLEVLRPAMVEAGLLLIPSHRSVSGPDEYGNTMVTVDYTLAHRDGEVWPEKITVVGCGNDKNSKGGVGDKGIYKAATGANKYLLFKLFQIETGDDPEVESAHDKDGTPVKQDDPMTRKNPPGRSKVITEVREHSRELHACEDSASLLAYIQTDAFKKFAFKVCCEFPNDWIGPEDNSGLSGVIAQLGVNLKCSDQTDAWVHKMERARDEKLKTKQAAE